MTRTSCHPCQHTASLRLREEFRRTAGGHTEVDGKTVVCGACGDSWHFRDRVQLPEWLRQELTDRGLWSGWSLTKSTRRIDQFQSLESQEIPVRRTERCAGLDGTTSTAGREHLSDLQA